MVSIVPQSRPSQRWRSLTSRKGSRFHSLEVEFVHGKQPPWENVTGDALYLLAPHQREQTVPQLPEQLGPKGGLEIRTAACVCGPASDTHSPRIDTILKETKHTMSLSTIWIDPRGIPGACLSRVFGQAVDHHLSTPNATLGIVVPEVSNMNSKEGTPKEETDNSLPAEEVAWRKVVWYPSMSLHKASLQSTLESIEPMDIFPIVECPSDDTLQPDFDTPLLEHMEMLEDQRVRTEKVIYIRSDRPNDTYGLLRKSFESLEIGESIPRTPVVTLGGTGPSLLAMVLATVTSGAKAFPAGGILFPRHQNDIWGYAVIRRKE